MIHLKEIVYMKPNTMYNEYTPIKYWRKKHVIKEMWGYTPIMLGTGEAEAEGSQ